MLLGLNIRNRRFVEKATKKNKKKKRFLPVTDPLSLAHLGKKTPFGRSPHSDFSGFWPSLGSGEPSEYTATQWTDLEANAVNPLRRQCDNGHEV